jgi:hypothetical protein
MGGYTQEAGKRFYVRKEFTDEGKKHALRFYQGSGVMIRASLCALGGSTFKRVDHRGHRVPQRKRRNEFMLHAKHDFL